MKFNQIAILTSETSWFVPYAKKLASIMQKKVINAKVFFRHEDIKDQFDIVYILSYFRIINSTFLNKHKHNLVVHESDLPKGRGWSPLFWQILEGKKKIPIVLFEAEANVDSGDIYFKDYLTYDGGELYFEVREKQAQKTIELCLKFIDMYDDLKPYKQQGNATYYQKRTPADSELNINKSIKEQFDLLRIVDNENFPAFFNYQGNRYFIEINKEKF